MRRAQRTGWVGIDVGTRAVKLAQVAHTPDGAQLVQAVVLPRTTPWTREPLRRPRSSAGEIQSACQLAWGLKQKQAACVAPMAVCQLHTLHVERPEHDTWRTELAAQLTEAAGSDSGPRIYDGWLSQHPDDAHDASLDNLNAISLPEAWSDQLARDVNSAGLTCRVLDALPTALARAVGLIETRAERTIAAVDWGASAATVCIVLDGRPLFVRRLRDSGFQEVIDALCHQLGISGDEALTLLSDIGLATSSTARTAIHTAVNQIIRDAGTGFVREIERTLMFLQTHRANLLPEKCFLFGGGALVRGIAEYLSGQLQLPVCRWQLPVAADCNVEREATGLLGPAAALSVLGWSIA